MIEVNLIGVRARFLYRPFPWQWLRPAHNVGCLSPWCEGACLPVLVAVSLSRSAGTPYLF